MKKSVKSLILCLASVLGVGAFATACGESDDHVHTYSDEWIADSEGHFRDYTCDCGETPAKEAHVDDDNDGVCEVCNFSGCEHTYSEDWTADADNHWHAADCGHDVAGVDLAAHADGDEDGRCDDCGYQVGELHEHTYSNAWSYDTEYHWHAVDCGHDVEVKDKAAHNINAAGDCTVCGAHIKDVDMQNIEEVLAATMANEYKINGGFVTASEMVYGNPDATYVESGKTDVVSFTLGDGVSYIKWDSYDEDLTATGSEEQWHQQLGDEEFFGVKLVSGSETKERISSAAQFLKGYTYYPGSILGSMSDDTSTLANTFMGLYNKMKAGVNVSAATEGYDQSTDKYSFLYTYYSVNATTTYGEVTSVELHYYIVNVTFSVDENMIIDEADWTVTVYRDFEADSDLAYDWVDNGDGTATVTNVRLKDSANPSVYAYKVTQTAGARTYENPYVKENLIPSSFEFSYVNSFEWNEDCTAMIITKETPIGDRIEVLTGEYAKFHIGSYLPETADPSFLDSSDFKYTFVNKDATSTARCWYESDSIWNGFSSYQNMLKLKIRDVGEYTVTITVGGVTKTFDLIVKAEDEPVLDEDDASTVNVATTDTYNWEQDKYSYTASAAGTYTFNLPAGLGLWVVDASYPEMDFYDNESGESVEFYLEAGETLQFYVAATTRGSWVIEVDFVAGE